VLNLIPFADAARQMVDIDIYAKLIGEVLQFPFSQAHARAVAAAAIGGDGQMVCVG
jgi:hypothetical protein